MLYMAKAKPVRTHASIVWRHAGIGEFGEFGELQILSNVAKEVVNA